VDFQPIAKYFVRTVAGSVDLGVTIGADYKQCYVEGPGVKDLTVFLRDYCGRPTNGECVVKIKNLKSSTNKLSTVWSQ